MVRAIELFENTIEYKGRFPQDFQFIARMIPEDGGPSKFLIGEIIHAIIEMYNAYEDSEWTMGNFSGPLTFLRKYTADDLISNKAYFEMLEVTTTLNNELHLIDENYFVKLLDTALEYVMRYDNPRTPNPIDMWKLGIDKRCGDCDIVVDNDDYGAFACPGCGEDVE